MLVDKRQKTLLQAAADIRKTALYKSNPIYGVALQLDMIGALYHELSHYLTAMILFLIKPTLTIQYWAHIESEKTKGDVDEDGTVEMTTSYALTHADVCFYTPKVLRGSRLGHIYASIANIVIASAPVSVPFGMLGGAIGCTIFCVINGLPIDTFVVLLYAVSLFPMVTHVLIYAVLGKSTSFILSESDVEVLRRNQRVLAQALFVGKLATPIKEKQVIDSSKTNNNGT